MCRCSLRNGSACWRTRQLNREALDPVRLCVTGPTRLKPAPQTPRTGEPLKGGDDRLEGRSNELKLDENERVICPIPMVEALKGFAPPEHQAMLPYGTEFWSRDRMTRGKLINRSGGSRGFFDTLELRDYGPWEVRGCTPMRKRCANPDARRILRRARRLRRRSKLSIWSENPTARSNRVGRPLRRPFPHLERGETRRQPAKR
jgi:hypothetical protein